MYYIPQEDWDKIPDDYKGRSVCHPELRVVFEGAIPKNKGFGGTNLLFEHKHFEIIPDTAEH